jgi:hypothetical protein
MVQDKPRETHQERLKMDTENRNKNIVILAVLIPFLLVILVAIFVASDTGSDLLDALHPDRTSPPLPTPTRVEDVLCGVEIYQEDTDTGLAFIFDGRTAKNWCVSMLSQNGLPSGYRVEQLRVEAIEPTRQARTLKCGLIDEYGNGAYVYAATEAMTEPLSFLCKGMHIVESP